MARAAVGKAGGVGRRDLEREIVELARAAQRRFGGVVARGGAVLRIGEKSVCLLSLLVDGRLRLGHPLHVGRQHLTVRDRGGVCGRLGVRRGSEEVGGDAEVLMGTRQHPRLYVGRGAARRETELAAA